jgi:hypothetical protein
MLREGSIHFPLSRRLAMLVLTRRPGEKVLSRYVARIPKGYRTKLVIHDQFTHQMRDRLDTTVLGLGLVRLLQDAGRIKEARTTLYSLENGGVESDKPNQKPCKATGLKSINKTASCSSGSARTDAAKMRPQALCLV